MIFELVKKFTQQKDIIFITSNYESVNSGSSDIDVYCVTNGRSSVELFYNQAVWTEIFIDNISDVYKKIENVDEIAINFLCELPFLYGDRSKYIDLLNKASSVMKNYQIPSKRKNILKYRIKVLLSKYVNRDTEDQTQNKFIINAISYPLIQLILEYHNIFPSSPKRWILQLRDKLQPSEFEIVKRFLSHQCDRNEVIDLCERYAKDLEPMHIEKDSHNDTTFLS